MQIPIPTQNYARRSSTEYIVVHCSANTPPWMQRRATPYVTTAADVDRYHRQNGWWMIGYNAVVEYDGSVTLGRPMDAVGGHCVAGGMNSNSVGVCLMGGLDADGQPSDTFSAAQMLSLGRVVDAWQRDFRVPHAKVIGHRDAIKRWGGNPKACPCFSVGEWMGVGRSGAPQPPRIDHEEGSAALDLPRRYVVRVGDGLWRISQITGVRLEDLLTINDLRTDSVIHPGQVLKLEK